MFAKLVDDLIPYGCCFWVSGHRENKDVGGKGIITSTPVGFIYGFTPVTYKMWSYLSSFCCQILQQIQTCATAVGPSICIFLWLLYSNHLDIHKNVHAWKCCVKTAYKMGYNNGTHKKVKTINQHIMHSHSTKNILSNKTSQAKPLPQKIIKKGHKANNIKEHSFLMLN